MKKVNYNKELIEEAVQNSTCYSDVLRYIGLSNRGNNIITIKKYINTYNISIEHFTGRKINEVTKYKNSYNYLYEGSKITSSKLLKKLINDGIKEYKCEICGISKWLDKPIVLQLHHLDGNYNNNNLDNLQILCPNCHSQTNSYCGLKNKKKIFYCEVCGKELKTKSKKCFYCAAKDRRKPNRPSKEELLKILEENRFNYSAVGRIYNVSDNSIRKWIK